PEAIDPLADMVDRRVLAVMDSANLPGVAVVIVQGDRVLHLAGFGVADRASGRPVEPTTLFQIGSASKSFTSTLLALLLERGELALDDPVSRYLPCDVDVPDSPTEGPIALRHLALHTSGLPRQPPTLRRSHGDAPVLAFTHFELLQSIERAELEHPTGKGWQYSNFGYSVLGHALERAAETPYETLLRREIFTPLRMTGSTVTLWPRSEALLARPYYRNRENAELEVYTPWDTEAMAPAGGIASSAQDLARYLSFHLGAYADTDPVDGEAPSGDGAGMPGAPDGAPYPVASLLPAASIRALHEPQVRINDELSYALGWFVREVTGIGRVVEHGGEVDGYTSYLALAPEAGVGVAVLTNVGAAPIAALGDWILGQAVRGADR
ncbi:MAG: serine hydrolase domain-containing protein, partial [Gemmatimonadota bacterium]